MSFEPSSCQTPIVFIVFNRPELTRRVFNRIAQVRPTRLLIVADGARTERLGEAEICQSVRTIAAGGRLALRGADKFREQQHGVP